MEIKRIEPSKRMSRAVVCNGIVWLGGLTAPDTSQDIRGQTRQVLKRVEEFLAKAGSDKSQIVSAQIWLRDIDQHFEGMNEVWDAWVSADGIPARATGEARLAHTGSLIEIIVTAAVRD